MTRLHHLAVTVTSMPTSSAFYATFLQLLGYERGYTSDGLCTWVGPDPEILLYPVEGDDASHHRLGRPGWHHGAFAVEDRDTVDAVYKAALAGEWTIIHEPREYPDYAERYYAVYLDDPDGARLEVAHIPVPTH